MKIGICLNEVLRDTLSQMAYTYKKYIDESFDEDVIAEDLDEDLSKTFKFKNKDDYNYFLYIESSLEIFGHADQLYENLFSKLNSFLLDIEDEEEHEIILISKENGKSVPATLFFLSKLSASFKNIKFVSNYEDKWNEVDILITANPIALKSKPEGKISVKVNCPYNNNSDADYEIDSIVEIIESEELRNKIFN